MTSVTAREIFCYCPPIFMQEALFAWLNAKFEKITTDDKFENYGFFAQYYTILTTPYESYFNNYCTKFC